MGIASSSSTLAAVGDAILTHRLRTNDDPQIQGVFDRIRAADASIANLELPLVSGEVPPLADRSGMYFRGEPWVADELQWGGFDLFTAANNHIGDYGQDGMDRTIDELESREIPYAGLGRNLAGAREPAYVDTPAGTVGVVAAAVTFIPGTEAGQQRPDAVGRTGLSPLRLETTYVLEDERFESIRTVSDHLGVSTDGPTGSSRSGFAPALKENASIDSEDAPDEHYLLDVDVGAAGGTIRFERGDSDRVVQQSVERDVGAITRQVRRANQQADWVVCCLHCHEGADAVYNNTSVPAFLESFAHDCIDAGGDVFVGHGPHRLRSIEIYQDAPIFYSLGNFIVQYDTLTTFPQENYDFYGLGTDALPSDLYNQRSGILSTREEVETVLPICSGTNGAVDRIELQPLLLRSEESERFRGVPQLSRGADAEGIVTRLGELSTQYGTTISYDPDEEVGVVDVGA